MKRFDYIFVLNNKSYTQELKALTDIDSHTGSVPIFVQALI